MSGLARNEMTFFFHELVAHGAVSTNEGEYAKLPMRVEVDSVNCLKMVQNIKIKMNFAPQAWAACDPRNSTTRKKALLQFVRVTSIRRTRLLKPGFHDSRKMNAAKPHFAEKCFKMKQECLNTLVRFKVIT